MTPTPPSPTELCPSCGAPAPLSANFCPRCGKPLTLVTGSGAARGSTSRWYHNIWFVLLMLFFVLGPFGLPLVWKNPRLSRTVKIVLTLAMVAYTVMLVQTTIAFAKLFTEQMSQMQSVLGF